MELRSGNDNKKDDDVDTNENNSSNNVVIMYGDTQSSLETRADQLQQQGEEYLKRLKTMEDEKQIRQ